MILTSTGRRTGRARKTPLWYVRDRDHVYCFSGWGSSSDWLKNLEVNPSAQVRVGKGTEETRGVIIQDPQQIEKVLNMFLQKYGRLVRVIYHMDRLVLVAFPVGGSGD